VLGAWCGAACLVRVRVRRARVPGEEYPAVTPGAKYQRPTTNYQHQAL